MNKPIIASLAGHSALDIFSGAKARGFNTLALLVKGRDKTYSVYYKNLCDTLLYLDSFSQLTTPSVVKQLNNLNSVFIPHRYIQVYCNLTEFENDFAVPVFGNRKLLKFEEREGRYNQYLILHRAGVDYPRQFDNPRKIDRLVIIKVREKSRNYERGFFFAGNYKDYLEKSKDKIKRGQIKKSDLESAVIEEYLVGVQVNFNFFYSSLSRKLELMGVDTRRQTNIDGLIRLPYFQQKQFLEYSFPSYIESGHIAVTVKESLLETAYLTAEKIITAARKIASPGIIGPFALQTVIVPGPPKEKIIVFDLSLRIPGSPGTGFTPYSGYLYGKSISFGDRIIMEIENGIKFKKLSLIIS